ncbi:J domain-containing protein [Cyanobacterium stanieri LEGE 03274]|uniref:J domain-containing protein n=1 Tax=Cyanobacterium stanieri LEGE 03274 TaxID=1828756 RepID=A0ABR9V4Q7_9CHRO|nr:J domain-containing protein [Cyanobacterium stanieri]MBE9222884.1 J domain-containing protein [Cyanobacterium stanieri LEGE 03274]
MENNKQNSVSAQGGLFAHTHYGLLGLHPSASELDIRRAYRELSKLYHPDTTSLPLEEARSKFQCLNEAYGVLANPERRSLYDLQIGYSRWNVIQSPFNFHEDDSEDNYQSSAYLDPTDRPLSSGELFALLLMGITLFACLLLALSLAWLRA